MTSLTRTQAGKVVLFVRATGERLERWPVDAREMLASGEYTAVPPQVATTNATAPEEPADSSAGNPTTQPSEVANAAPVAAASEQTDADLFDADPAKPDPMPHVTEAAKLTDGMSPTGAPLVIAPATGVSAAAPVRLPQPGQRSSGPGRGGRS